jgi:16S rRNA (guanine527-N7)-methyltransferase
MSRENLDLLVQQLNPEISESVRIKILDFYDILVRENESQNLTRLIEPSDFYHGHLVDVLELIKTGWMKFPVLDLGSGGGVPGLLAGVVGGGAWILSDSESRKAEYLQKAVTSLGLDKQIQVDSHRAEEYLREHSVESIVARAVGPVERIYSWIRNCSTWNTLILFKGPGWSEEWNRFQSGKYKKELAVHATHQYTVGPEKKSRIIVLITRVPRGTKTKLI